MYTEKEITAGIGCYTTRITYIFANGVQYATGEDLHDCPAGFWLCGIRQPDAEIVWL